MNTRMVFPSALLLQLAAQWFGGAWGAAVAGLLIGLAMRDRRTFRLAFRIAFGSALLACALLLAYVSARGGNVLTFANMIGGNFKLPGWSILLVTLLLPALQAGGIAGGTARLTARAER